LAILDNRRRAAVDPTTAPQPSRRLRSVPIIRQLDQLPAEARGGAVTIGNFDGVHRGHRQLVERLLERSAELPGPPLVLTFDPHPVRLLRPEQCPPPLTWTQRKAELLATLGVEWMVAYPTDRALLELSARQFYDQIVIEALGARALIEGPNFYFGHNREGSVAQLAEWSAESGVPLEVVAPIKSGGELVSSSRIRALVASGEVAQAADLLIAPYRIRGMVTHGAGRGAGIGFPTANLQAIDTLLPAQSVYAGRAFFAGETAAAAIHIGPNPTFGEAAVKVEVHLIDRQVALYGQPLEVELLTRLRGIEPFSSPQELVAQLQRDVDRAREVVATTEIR
jgi:riboflavin kinase/FMN adenylyltransferase